MLSLGVDSRRMTGRDPPRFEDSKSKGRPFKGGNEANSAMFAHDVRCRTSLPSRWRDQLPLVGVYAAELEGCCLATIRLSPVHGADVVLGMDAGSKMGARRPLDPNLDG